MATLRYDLTKGIITQNPIFVLALGLCPALAVSNSVDNALGMSAAVTFVLLFSNLMVSSIRRIVPETVRIPTFIIIIATFVTVVDYAIQAISLDLYEALGAYIKLIVANCILLGRAEAHAAKNPPLPATTNALGMGLGFTLGLFLIGCVREILGAGKLFGVELFGDQFQPWVVMVLPPGGFFVLAFWLIVFAAFRHINNKRNAQLEGVQP